MSELETRVGHWFEHLAEMTPDNLEARRDVELVITKLDDGQVRVAEVGADGAGDAEPQAASNIPPAPARARLKADRRLMG